MTPASRDVKLTIHADARPALKEIRRLRQRLILGAFEPYVTLLGNVALVVIAVYLVTHW